MLSKDHYYYEMIKKYTVAFYHIFDDIHVIRADGDTIVKDIKVPVTYAGKSKLFYLLQRKESIGTRLSTVLPRVTFLITGLSPDPARKESNVNTIRVQMQNDHEDILYAPVPYNFTVSLSVWAEYTDDMMQIIEQIAPFFKPDFTMLVEEIGELEIRRNISTVLNGVTLDVANEFQDEQNRIVSADFDFTIKGYLYPPISDDYIIKMINIRLTDFNDRCLDYAEINHTFDELNYNLVSNGLFRVRNANIGFSTSSAGHPDRTNIFAANPDLETETDSDIDIIPPSFLLINDGGDHLDINDAGDDLLIS